MKKYGISLAIIIFIGLGIGGWYWYTTMNRQHELADLMKAFFDEAQRQLPIVLNEMAELEQAGEIEKSEREISNETTETGTITYAEPDRLKFLKERLHSLNMIDIIKKHNLMALKNMPPEELQRGVTLFIDAEILKKKGILPDLQTDQGVIRKVALGGNSLAIVIFYSTLVKTTQERQAVLDMLHILFDKKIDSDDHYNTVGMAYFVQPEGEQFLRDFIVDISLDKTAGFKAAKDVLQTYRESFKKQ